jgi:hypothetical protein
MLVSVACEVESEKNLRRRPPGQQPIYSDDIHRFHRYVVDAAPPGAMDVLRTDVIGRSIGGAVSQRAHASSDLIRLGGHDGSSNLERWRSEFDSDARAHRRLERAGAIHPAARSAEGGQFLTVVSGHSDGWQDVCRFAFLERENGVVASGSAAPSTPASDRRG